MLKSDDFLQFASTSNRTKMIELANSVGDGARMKLLPSAVFTASGGPRLPHSSEALQSYLV